MNIMLMYNIINLTYHGKDGSRVHVVDKLGEEGLGGEVGIVLLQVLLARLKYANKLTF